MKINQLKLQNFRNFDELTLDFKKSVTLILAPNTSGKTNILEAIFYLASGHSFRADVEQELIQKDKNFANLEGKIANQEDRVALRVFLQRSEKTTILGKKKVEVNDVSRRLSSFLGNFQAVLFSPQDLNLVTDSPSKRRKYLDTVLSQTSSAYYRSLSQYQKVITRRNKLLENIREKNLNTEQLFYWNDKLLKLGQLIFYERKDLLSFFNQEMKTVGEKFNSQKDNLKLIYYPSLLSSERLRAYQMKEIAAGQSLIGPHRDDFGFFWKDYDLEKYGSRGEQRLVILALKMAELSFIRSKTGEMPVLLLDDIFSELDLENRQKLTFLFGSQQTIITSTEEEVFEILEDLKDIETMRLR